MKIMVKHVCMGVCVCEGGIKAYVEKGMTYVMLELRVYSLQGEKTSVGIGKVRVDSLKIRDIIVLMVQALFTLHPRRGKTIHPVRRGYCLALCLCLWSTRAPTTDSNFHRESSRETDK